MDVKRIIVLAAILTGICVAGNSRAEMPSVSDEGLANHFAGKSGEGLAAAIRKEYRISRMVAWEAVTFSFYDYYTGMDVDIKSGELPIGYVATDLVPSVWWSEVDIYGDTLSRDLNNLVLLTTDAAVRRGELLPAESLTEVDYDNGLWSVGRGMLYGTLTDLYVPPVASRGRLARAYFYMAVMYPHNIFTAHGYNMMETSYPYLGTYGAELFSRWAEEHPVEPSETEWNDYVAALQGHGNPFVEYPELADYIWGAKAGEAYQSGYDPVPLHSEYTVSGDVPVNLFSPHIPEDAVWRIDGNAANAGSYAPGILGVGEHHLEYSSVFAEETGYVMIKVSH